MTTDDQVLFCQQLAAMLEAGIPLLRSLEVLSAQTESELLLSAILPIVFLSRRSYRESPTALFWIATAAIVGMSLNRVNVAGLATLSATQATYIPSWAEWFVTLGILSAAGLV